MTIVESTSNMVKEVLMSWCNALKGLFNNYIAYEYGDLKPNKEDKKDYKESTQNSLKPFLIKLISVSFAVIVVISILFNMIFAERLEKIDNILFLDQSRMRNDVKDKIRSELSKGLNKKNMISYTLLPNHLD